MTTPEIAKRLVELCRQGNYAGAHAELYAEDCVSIEPEGTPENVTKGMEGIRGKAAYFAESMEVHGGTVGDPIVADPFFSCVMTLDATDKKAGVRMNMAEICVYEVRGGKIVREQFFYPLPPTGC